MISYIKNIVTKLDLKLQGRVVLTECASGAYAYTPIIALCADADKVYCYGKSTNYGSFSSNQLHIQSLTEKFNLEERIIFLDSKEDLYEILPEVDIVTNSGMLRPFDRKFFSLVNPNSVLCLMWEPWELRDSEIDLGSAKDFSIPIVGTNESYGPLSMYGVPLVLFFKMAFEAGFSVTHDSFAIVGGFLTGELIAKDLKKLNYKFDWFANGYKDGVAYKYLELSKLLNYDYLDFIFIAEHHVPEQIFCQKNGLTLEQLKRKFPNVVIIHLCGNVSQAELDRVGIDYFPSSIAKFGYMSYQSANFNDKPVVALNAMGLKVGQTYSDSYLKGYSKEESILSTVKSGIGMSLK